MGPGSKKWCLKKNAKQKKKKKLSTVPNKKATNMYLILPSYAKSIKQRSNVIAKEKSQLCTTIFFRNTFENVDFKLACSNSRNNSITWLILYCSSPLDTSQWKSILDLERVQT